ncbi:hypothetical protein LH128_05885 [Sphingomonas sp. LH128]|uniref:SGNH/GDSL hydrolase family protein n=1 Tax=Sphingomonas sp. LH128 TaxID=473781 RepID=UPI00027CA6E8|nr:SGNH/GDSL hydrolase family protein [Sphingomonas sp. LH128]EJU14005.1 hypothetical protein LH128_05885 [Sphingomonas sp. LH128]
MTHLTSQLTFTVGGLRGPGLDSADLAIIDDAKDDARAAAGFTLHADAIAFAPKMAAGDPTIVYGEAAGATRAAVAGEVRLDGTAAAVGEQIPLNGRYTKQASGTPALLRTGSLDSQLAALAGTNIPSSSADNRWRDGFFRALYDENAAAPAMYLDNRAKATSSTGNLTWDLTASPHGNPALVCSAAQTDFYHYTAESMILPGQVVSGKIGLFIDAGTTIRIEPFIRRGFGGAIDVTGDTTTAVGTGAYQEFDVKPMTNGATGTAILYRLNRTVGTGSYKTCTISLNIGAFSRPVAEDKGSRYVSSLALARALLAPQMRPKNNRFNKATTTAGYYVNSGNGTLLANSGYQASDWIDISDLADGSQLTRTHARQMAFFSAKGDASFISGVATSTGTPETVVKPVGAKYMRVSATNAEAATLSIEPGTVAVAGRAYQLVVPSEALALTSASLPDGLVTPEKTSFFVVGKNKINPADPDVVAGYYINSDSGVLAANASYSTSGWVRLKPNTAYSTSDGRQLAFFTENRTYISGRAATGTPGTFTTPANCAWGRFSILTNTLGVSFQIEEGSAPTSFEAYRIIVDPTRISVSGMQPVQDIVLPRKVYVLTGATGTGNVEQSNLYFKNIIRGYRGDKLVDCIASKGRHYEDFWRIEPGNTGFGNDPSGSFSLQLNINDYSFATLKAATTTITPVSKTTPTTPVRLLMVGDSITRDGSYGLQAVNKLPAITLQGTRHYSTDNAALNREGRGGWTLAQYMTSAGLANGKDSPFLFPVGISGSDYKGNTEFWRRAINISAYPDDNYDLDGFQKLARGWADSGAYLYDANGYPTAPANGWVVYDPNLAAGSRFQTWNGSAWVAMGSQPASWAFDFGKYLVRFAAAFAGGNPTHISILLSANDFQTLTSSGTAAALPAFKANLDALIASARAALPTVKVIINVPTIGAPQDAWGLALGSGGTSEQYNQNMQASGRYLLDAYDTPTMEAAGTYVCAFGLFVDPVYGFDSQNENPNIYATGTTVVRYNNWVHPNGIGHKQMGDALAALVQATR